jgi:hypothetical protein
MSVHASSPNGKVGKPQALPVLPDNIPAELKERAQWVCWRYVWNPDKKRKDGKGKGDWDKPPLNVRNGWAASSTKPATWGTFADALAAYEQGGYDGIGFVPTPEDGLAVIDLDGCRNPQSGDITPQAARIVAEMDTYTEVSPSATGFRIIGRGRKPDRERSKEGPVEIYDGLTAKGKPAGRYLTITGNHVENTPRTVNHRQEQLAAVYCREVKGGGSQQPKATAGTAATASASSGVFTVRAQGRRELEQLIARCATAADRSKAEFAVCCEASRLGIDKEEIWQRLQAVGKVKERGRDYFDSTWENAEDEVRQGQTAHLNGTGRNGAAHHQQDPEPDYPPDAQPGDGRDGKPQRLSAYSIILADFRERYQPTFRRGTSLYSGALGRQVNAGEACFGAGINLITRLAEAIDAPRDRKGVVDWARLPYLFRDWCRSAWTDLLKDLPDEDRAAEVSGDAQEDFRSMVRAALLTIVALGHTYRAGGDERTETQRRSLYDWCSLWAKLGKWEGIRSYQLWARREAGENNVSRLRIALRVDLFTQINHPGLAKIRQGRFAKLCELYDVGTAGGEDGRVHGKRVVELSPGFIEEMRCQPPVADLPEGDASPARTRENERQNGKKEVNT